MDALWKATESIASYTRCILIHNKIVYILYCTSVNTFSGSVHIYDDIYGMRSLEIHICLYAMLLLSLSVTVTFKIFN